jgi:hypothetical protein
MTEKPDELNESGPPAIVRLRRTPRDYAPRDKLGTGGTGRRGGQAGDNPLEKDAL